MVSGAPDPAHGGSIVDVSDTAELARRNTLATSLGSFFTDISSEMVVYLLPLYMAGGLGVGVAAIAALEGVAEAVASLLKVVSGRWSDRIRSRKGLTVAGYALSTAAKPFFAVAATWGQVAAVRWAERVGKGVRTAPRDALLADSVGVTRRGWAFGLHRAADTAGAAVGLAAAIAILGWVGGGDQAPSGSLDPETFRTVVLWSVLPALLGVLALAWIAREPPRSPAVAAPTRGGRLPVAFWGFLGCVAVFELGNSTDALLVLRAAERGLSAREILWALLAFNVVYALASAPAGRLSDALPARWGRRGLLVAGWLLYAAVYLGFALASSGAQMAWLIAAYGLHHALVQGAAKALVADLVPSERRGAAYGTLAATVGLLDLPASLLGGLLWQGGLGVPALGPAAPFWFGAGTAVVAAALLGAWTLGSRGALRRDDRSRNSRRCGPSPGQRLGGTSSRWSDRRSESLAS